MRALFVLAALALVAAAFFPMVARSDDAGAADPTAAVDDSLPKVDDKIGADTTTQTDSNVVEREEQAIRYDGLSVAETKMLREAAEKHEFQAEVSRMMKLIINSLYKNKEIFLRELISNASDALDKIRFLSLTDASVLGDQPDLQIKIQVDKENKVMHITDTGIGMTKQDLEKNLGTIARSGTSEFLAAMQAEASDTSSLIGQFGVGFYSAFLVADRVVVTTKHNDDEQYIWESDASSYTITKDPRTEEVHRIKRGTRISLYLKEEAQEYLETNEIRNLIRRYSEFISHDIFLYTSKQVDVEVEDDDGDDEEEEEGTADEATAEEVAVEEEGSDEAGDSDAAPKTKTVKETVWDWEIINANKPIWTRNPKEIEDEEYNKFFKAFTKDSKDPIGHIHFTAEGEVTFRSILYIPSEAPRNFFNEYGRHSNNLKMYVRRVFITDEFEDMMPKYLSFIQGIVDSDDLPLNVSRETLQQHKLLKVIRKKLVRKALDMIKKLDEEQFKKFWKEYGTAIKLGLIEDYSNRTKLSKLLRFHSSHSADELVSLDQYVERMKENQASIFFLSGASREEVEKSPFVERLLKRGFEVLYLIEPVDEYTIQNLPEYENKKFQNAAKEGLTFGDETEKEKAAVEELTKEYEPLTKWLGEELGDAIEKAVVSTRLAESPCALVASQYGWSGNMERIMTAQAYSKSDDPNNAFYAKQKKTLEINPRHPLIKTLRSRVDAFDGADDAEQQTTKELAQVLVDTARLRSGYALADSATFASRIERMLRLSLGVDPNATVDPEPDYTDDIVEGGADGGDDDEDEETIEDVEVADEVPAADAAPEHTEL